MPKNWKPDHDPENPPVGCNGKPGESGRKRHKRRGEPNCQACSTAAAHAARERRRGAGMPRPLKPCGTPAAAKRHREKGERLCLPCAVAEARYHADHRYKMRHPQCKAGHYLTPENIYTRGDGGQRCRECMADQYRAKRARQTERIAA